MWIYFVTLIALTVSVSADPARTGQALAKAWRIFLRILFPTVLILFTAACAVTIIPTGSLARWIGPESSFFGIFLASTTGTLFLMPGFIAFPMARMFLDNGAGIPQMAAFISSLMMVGALSIPLEKRVFGLRIAIFRNILAYFYAFIVALMFAFAQI